MTWDYSAEELDPLTGRVLGNFPQAYSHVRFDQLRAQSEPTDRAGGGAGRIVRPRDHMALAASACEAAKCAMSG